MTEYREPPDREPPNRPGKPHPQRRNYSQGLHSVSGYRGPSRSNANPPPQIQGKKILGNNRTQLQPAPSSPPPPPPTRSGNWFLQWQIWGLMIVVVAGSLGFVATALLLKLPTVPNCPTIFWPIASASVRLYCAQLAANKETPEDLLYSIRLVENLPKNHPLWGEIERHLDVWVETLLEMGEAKFQEGKLKEALSLAQEVASKVKDPAPVQKQMKKWREIWAKGEKIEQEAETLMKDAKWGLAFQAAGNLTKLDNRYWSDIRYKDLFDRLELARKESEKLDEAFARLKQGGLDNLAKAIEIAQQISTNSTAYKEAQTLIDEAGAALMKIAEDSLAKGDWQNTLAAINLVPGSLEKLQDRLIDLKSLAEAGDSAGVGTIESLEMAIEAAKKMSSDRPLYNKSQELIGLWQLEIEGITTLAEAEQLASNGTTDYLNSAIAQARLISSGNPRYREAQQKIQEWNRQVQQQEDQPLLDRAIELANSGDPTAAIQQANQIGPNRALYREARQRVREWSNQIRETQERPLLDRAQTLANDGRFSEAIASARQIPANSPLAREAQGQIRNWERELTAKQQLDRAFQASRPGNPDALVNALTIASQIPKDLQISAQGQQAMDNWSEQLFTMARDQASKNLKEAIAIARRIPPNTSAYSPAQAQIENWEKILPTTPNAI